MVIFGLFGASVDALAGDGRRLALVVGNSDYVHADDLPNAAADALAISASLTRLGFEVVTLTDASMAQMSVALADMAERAQGSDAALFYYSGHGFQLSGANHIVPVDAILTDRGRIDAETLQLNAIIAELQDPDRPTLVLLDACRDNPLPPGVSDASVRGLAEIQKGDGVYVAFATMPGQVSYDGQAGDHSPFTQALLDNIEQPGIPVSSMMIAVRQSVSDQTGKRQTPYEQTALFSDFYFKPGHSAISDEQLMAAIENLPDDKKAAMGLIIGPAGKTVGLANRTAPSGGVLMLGAGGGPLAALPQPAPAAPPLPETTLPDVPVTMANVATPPQPTLQNPASTVGAPPGNAQASIPPAIPAVTPRTVPAPASVTPTPAAPTGPANVPPRGSSVEVASIDRAILGPVTGTTRTLSSAVTAVSTPASPATLVPAEISSPRLIGQDVTQPEPGASDNLIVANLPPAEPLPPSAPPVPDDLDRAVQAELKRIGCYTATVDGKWGNGSVRALDRYRAKRSGTDAGTRPTPALYRSLLAESGTVCDPPVANVPPVRTGGGSDNAPATPKATQPKAITPPKATPPKPTPAPASPKVNFGGVNIIGM